MAGDVELSEEDRGKSETVSESEWSDLAGLEGRELRERLLSRTQTYICIVNVLKKMQRESDYAVEKEDLAILIDLILQKEQRVTAEAERLWSEHLDSFDHYLDEPDGAMQIVSALGPQYLPVILDRRAQRQLRESAPHAWEHEAGKEVS